MPFALAVCQRNGDRFRQGHIVGRLQVPVQRLLEPVDVVLSNFARETDASVDVVGRVHVEHELDIGPDHLADSACARNLLGEREGTGFQLHRAESVGDIPCQFIRAGEQRRTLVVEAADGVGVDVGTSATQQAEHGLVGGFARDVPQRNIDARHRRHELPPLVARQRRRQAVPAAEPARPRHRNREQLAPHRVDRERVQPMITGAMSSSSLHTADCGPVEISPMPTMPASVRTSTSVSSTRRGSPVPSSAPVPPACPSGAPGCQ